MSTGHVHMPSREYAVRFLVWPARTLVASQFCILIGEAFPGMPAWIGSARQKLSPKLLDSLLVLNALGLITKLADEQLLAGRHALGVPQFIDWVAEFDENRLEELVAFFDPSDLDDTSAGRRRHALKLVDSVVSWDGIPLASKTWKRLMSLRENVSDLHALLVETLAAFWEKHLRTEFANQQPQLEACARRGGESFVGNVTFEDFLDRLVGRRRPENEDASADIREILAVPVLHFGPYARSSQVDLELPVYVVEFEAGRFLDRSRVAQGVVTASAFRALGDPSRLRIVRYLQTGEHYGNEIVDHVRLSQATVSGHLRLLVAEGIVSVRREGNTKYYSLNRSFLTQLERSIAQLKTLA